MAVEAAKRKIPAPQTLNDWRCLLVGRILVITLPLSIIAASKSAFADKRYSGIRAPVHPEDSASDAAALGDEGIQRAQILPQRQINLGIAGQLHVRHVQLRLIERERSGLDGEGASSFILEEVVPLKRKSRQVRAVRTRGCHLSRHRTCAFGHRLIVRRSGFRSVLSPRHE